jgi:hypothetical protein
MTEQFGAQGQLNNGLLALLFRETRFREYLD